MKIESGSTTAVLISP